MKVNINYDIKKIPEYLQENLQVPIIIEVI